jgi:hypothetical protein
MAYERHENGRIYILTIFCSAPIRKPSSQASIPITPIPSIHQLYQLRRTQIFRSINHQRQLLPSITPRKVLPHPKCGTSPPSPSPSRSAPSQPVPFPKHKSPTSPPSREMPSSSLSSASYSCSTSSSEFATAHGGY